MISKFTSLTFPKPGLLKLWVAEPSSYVGRENAYKNIITVIASVSPHTNTTRPLFYWH